MISDERLAGFLYPHPGCSRVDHRGHCGSGGLKDGKEAKQHPELSVILLTSSFMLLNITQLQLLSTFIMLMNTFSASGLYFMSYTSYKRCYINRCNT